MPNGTGIYDESALVWVLWEDNYLPGMIVNSMAPETFNDDGNHDMVYFFEDGSAVELPMQALCAFNPEDTEKMENPVAAAGLQAMRDQGYLAVAEDAAPAEEGGVDEEAAAEAKRLRKEEKKRKKEEKKAAEKAAKKEEKKAKKKEEKEKRKRQREADDEASGDEQEADHAAEASDDDGGAFAARNLDDIDDDDDLARRAEGQLDEHEDWAFRGGAGVLRGRGDRREADVLGSAVQPSQAVMAVANSLAGPVQQAAYEARQTWTTAYHEIEAEGFVGEKYLVAPQAEFVKQKMRRAERLLRFKLLSGGAEFEDPELHDNKDSKSITRTVSLPQRFKAPRLKTGAHESRSADCGAALPTLRDEPCDQRAMAQERMQTQVLTSLTEPVTVMTNWLSIRDLTNPVAEDVHGVPAYGAISKQFDQPQQTLKTNAIRYSAKLGGPTRNSGTLADLNRTLTQDYKDFAFEQTQQVVDGQLHSEMPASASIEVSSSYHDMAAAGEALDTQEFDEQDPRYTVQGEEYDLPASNFHPADGNSAQYNQGQSRQYSRAGSVGSRASVTSRRGTDAWQSQAARIVCSELTPYLKGSLGKPVLIDTTDDFSKLAKQLTNRALERKLHRAGQALGLAPSAASKERLNFSKEDEAALRQGVRKYMNTKEKKSIGSQSHASSDYHHHHSDSRRY